MKFFVVLFLFLASCDLFQQREHKKDGHYALLEREIERLSQLIGDNEREIINIRLALLDSRLQFARFKKDVASESQILKNSLASRYEDEVLLALKETSSLKDENLVEIKQELTNLIASKNNKIKVSSIYVVSRMKTSASESVLLKCCDDSESSVRKACAEGLRNYNDAESQKSLLKLAQDSHEGVRMAAIESLGSIKLNNSSAVMIDLLKKESNEYVIEKIIITIGQISNEDVQGELIPFLKHESNSVKWAAINVLGKIGNKYVIPYIKPFLAKSNPLALREISIQSLAKLKDSSSVDSVLEIIKEDSELLLDQCANFLVYNAAQIDPVRLLDVFMENYSTKTRSTLWKAVLSSAADNFSALEKLASVLIFKKLKLECDEILKKAEAVASDDDKKSRLARIRKDFANILYEGGDFVGAIEHYKKLEQNRDNLLQIAKCYKGLGDMDSAQSTLTGFLQKMDKKEKGYAEFVTELASVYLSKKDYKKVIEESFFATLDQAFDSKSLDKLLFLSESAVVALLDAKNTAEIKNLGKKSVHILLKMLESDGRKNYRQQVFTLLNSITLTSYKEDILDDKDKLKDAVKVWKGWVQRAN